MRILSNAPPQVVRVSEAYLKEDVKDVVITIPSYYTHVERSAIVAGDTLLLPTSPFKCLTKKITRVPQPPTLPASTSFPSYSAPTTSQPTAFLF